MCHAMPFSALIFFDVDNVVKTNRMWFSVVCTHIYNSMGHYSGQKLWAHSAAVMMMHTVVDKSTDNAKPHSICQISRTLKKSDDDDIN